jgi:hypothetical protein
VVRLHVALAIVVPGCVAAGGFELARALGGNTLSWVYVFEWPLFGAFAVHMWWRLLQEERAATEDVRADTADREGADGAPEPDDVDPELAAWNNYLARFHANDLPGPG